MNIWESYETLPPLERVIINFAVTALLIFVVYRINVWAKQRRATDPDIDGRKGNLEHQADGTLVAYIAFWRYLFFGGFFVIGFVLCISGFICLYRELPPGFYQHWDKAANMALFVFVLALAMLGWGYWITKDGYKKVQFELSKSHVRYLKNGLRGGILFSEAEVSVDLSKITAVELWQNSLGGGQISAQTATETHQITLLLPSEELQVCYQAIQDAIHHRQINQSPL